MDYKSILVQVDGTGNSTQRIRAAARLASTHKARLIGAINSGLSRFLHESLTFMSTPEDVTPYADILRRRAEDALAEFERIALSLGVSSLEKCLVDDETGNGISVLARLCDLAIVGQFDPDNPFARMMHDLPEHVAMNGGCPVLVMPFAGSFDTVGERILIAWNGSLQAARTVRLSVPLLQRARTVHIVLFHPGPISDEQTAQMSAGIVAYMNDHGIRADVFYKRCNKTTEGGMGDLLLSQVAELSSDLLLMGCYGQSRFREIMLGGATRTVLESMTVPVLMAH